MHGLLERLFYFSIFFLFDPIHFFEHGVRSPPIAQQRATLEGGMSGKGIELGQGVFLLSI
jgi:hypothetical protein